MHILNLLPVLFSVQYVLSKVCDLILYFLTDISFSLLSLDKTVCLCISDKHNIFRINDHSWVYMSTHTTLYALCFARNTMITIQGFVFEIWSGMNESDHRIFALLKKQ